MKLSRLIHIVVGGDAVYVRLFQFLSLLLVDLERHLVLRISDSQFFRVRLRRFLRFRDEPPPPAAAGPAPFLNTFSKFALL